MTTSVLILTGAPAPSYEYHTVYDDVEMATALVAHLNEIEDEGWSYKLKTNPNGTAVVEIYDETDTFVGLL